MKIGIVGTGNIAFRHLEEFNKIDNIEQYYPLGFLGHYNSKGYKKIAEIIEQSLD